MDLGRSGSRLVAVGIAAALAAACGDGSRSAPARVESGGLEIRASVEPATPRIGANRLWIEVRNREGGPVDAAELSASVRMPAMSSMPTMGGPLSVEPLGEGRFRADFELGMAGSWLVELRAGSAGHTARAEGSLTVGTSGLRLEPADGGTPAGAEPAQGGADAEPPGAFALPPERLQQVGVRVGAVERRELETTIRAVGRIVYDETALVDVSLKVRGWVGSLGVDAVGDPVRRGEVLFTLYSPELYAAQEEYLQALRSQARARETAAPDRADYLVRSARNRLRLWDVDPADIERVAREGAPIEHLPIRAPASGYVIEKRPVEGSAVEPGERLYRIAPLDRVWIEAEVYESEVPLVREGLPVTVTLPYLPGQSYEGRVAYVYPGLSGDTRTARLRIELPNPELELRPDMWATVRVHVQRGPRLVVPQSAVLYAGDRSFVFLERGAGRFQPREIQVGLRSGDDVEVLSGLEEGERVVVSGTFLVASESRLRAALEQW
jgi:membrane fusion protein, copper/silver efflux system